MQGGLDGLAAPRSAVVSTCMQGGLDGLAAPLSAVVSTCMQAGLDGLAAPRSAVVSTCMQGGLDGLAAPRSWDRGPLMGGEGRGCEGSEADKGRHVGVVEGSVLRTFDLSCEPPGYDAGAQRERARRNPMPKSPFRAANFCWSKRLWAGSPIAPRRQEALTMLRSSSCS